MLVDETFQTYFAHERRHRCEEHTQAKQIECGAQVHPLRWNREREAARVGPLIKGAISLLLEDTVVSLLAHTEFATTDAVLFALVGPSEQEAYIAVLADDFIVSMHVGVSPATAISWSEGHKGSKLLLKVLLGRQSDE